MSHVYLVGFMGAGKSTVGRILAERSGMPFVDLDDRIESTLGKTISEIFAEEGEESFRSREHEGLLGLESEPPSVIACGGGVILSAENRAFLKRTGTVVYVEVTAAEAIARVGESGTRPLLSSGGTAMAGTLLQAREALYRAVADVTVNTTGRTPEQVAQDASDGIEGRAGA